MRHQIKCADGCGKLLGYLDLPYGVDPSEKLKQYYATGHEPKIINVNPSLLTAEQSERFSTFKKSLGQKPLTADDLDQFIEILLRK